MFQAFVLAADLLRAGLRVSNRSDDPWPGVYLPRTVWRRRPRFRGSALHIIHPPVLSDTF